MDIESDTIGYLRLRELLRVQARVLFALMLRDINSRFFGSPYGFLIAIAWPLSHILVLLIVNTILGRAPPYGDSSALWYATGVVPFVAYSYMGRFIILGVLQGKPLLAFPLVKFTDVIFARMLVEFLSASLVVIIVSIIFTIFGINIVPREPQQAVYAFGAALLLGAGVGTVSAIITAAIPFWFSVFILSNIFLWAISGVVFVPDALPEPIRYVLSWNPMMHCIEWMRSAFYEGYGRSILDKSYCLACGTVWLTVGLIVERLVRGKIIK